jgi:hypothetical protein
MKRPIIKHGRVMSDIEDEWTDTPTTLGLTIYLEPWQKLGSSPERWTPGRRREFCADLRGVVHQHDKTARVVYQGSNTPEDKLPTSVIVWLEG